MSFLDMKFWDVVGTCFMSTHNFSYNFLTHIKYVFLYGSTVVVALDMFSGYHHPHRSEPRLGRHGRVQSPDAVAAAGTSNCPRLAGCAHALGVSLVWCGLSRSHPLLSASSSESEAAREPTTSYPHVRRRRQQGFGIGGPARKESAPVL
jgi:hypothetical protein